MVGEPVIKVWCDKCEYEEEFSMTALANGSYDDRDLERQLLKQNWRLEDGTDGKTFCPECAEGKDDAD